MRNLFVITRSAYLLYYFDVHQIMQQDCPNLPQSEINKRISESWKGLNVAEKGYYLEKAKLEREGIDTVRLHLKMSLYERANASDLSQCSSEEDSLCHSLTQHSQWRFLKT